jgi:alcohol dehydrogenase class IV
MITGFDVLTHAIETMTSKKSSQYTDIFCKTAINLVFKNLPKLHANINNINARNEMAYASMIMGTSLAISTTCLPHRMQYSIGGITDTPHALGLAAIYPAWMRHAVPFATKKFALGYNSIAKKQIDVNTEKNSLSFVNEVISLLERIGLKCSLNELGLKPKQIELMTTNISGNLETDPSFQSEKDIEKIYRDSFI